MNDAELFFSVVIPTYNRVQLISRAIKSVLDQTYKSFEIIIVDDGSTDNTREVVQSFNDDRIRYFFKENEERSIARNFGMSKARGRYIGFLDSDDYFYNHHFQVAYDILKTKDFPEVLHTGYAIVSDKDNRVLLTLANFSDSVSDNLIHKNHLSCNSMLLRADVFEQVTFIKDRNAVLSEDWCFWLRLASRFKIHYSNEVTNAVTEHESRSLNKLTALKVETATQLVFKELEADEIFRKYYNKLYDRFKAKQLCFIALHFAIERNSNKALQYCRESFKLYNKILFTRSFIAVLKKIVFLKFNVEPNRP